MRRLAGITDGTLLRDKDAGGHGSYKKGTSPEDAEKNGLSIKSLTDLTKGQLSGALAAIAERQEYIEDYSNKDTTEADEEKESELEFEYGALGEIERSLKEDNSLSHHTAKPDTKTAVALKDGKIVAAGLMSVDMDGKTAFVDHLGSVERGAGKFVLASLINTAKSLGLKSISAEASPAAIKLNKKFGFKATGPMDSGNHGRLGLPMSLQL